MSKLVLGNDPFKTAAVATDKPDSGKPNTGKPKPATKKAVKKKSTKGKAVKKPAQKKKVVKKAATKKTANKKSVAIKKASNKKKIQTKKVIKTKIKNSDVATVPQQPVIKQLAIGGGDAKLLKTLRPDNFDLGEEYGFDPAFSKAIEPIIKFLHRFYWRVTVKGAENIPKSGRAVLVGNHAGILPFDGLMLNNAIRLKTKRKAWHLIEDFFYYAPVLGSFLSKAGAVRACQENAQRLLAEDEMVIVFPEGIKGILKPYSRRYRLQRFGRGGFVKLCLKSDSPVIPVAIVGSEEANPVLLNMAGIAKIMHLPYFPITPLFPLLGLLGLIPLPSKWTIIIGEPIHINQFGEEAASDRVAVNRLSNEVKSQIQKMIDMEIGQRNSRWY